MPYGIIKVDTITFTDAGVDKSIQISGLVQNPTFSGNVTCTGTISGVTVTGTVGAFTTVSGITVTGTTANFTSGNFTNISGGIYTITSGVFAAGSAASPSISFTGDSNTGLYSPGADQVAISTNGTGRLFIGSTGQVGIGKVPTQLFDIEASGNAQMRVTTTDISGGNLGSFVGRYTGGGGGTASTVVLRAGDGYTSVGASTNSPLLFINNETERMRLDTSGRLGLGTSSPSAILDVRAVTGNAKIQVQETTTNRIVQLESDSSYAALYSTGARPVYLYSNGSIALTIDSSQRVGIGTTSPQNLLHVNGTGGVRISDSANAVLNIRGDSGANSYIYFAESSVAERGIIGYPAGSGDLVYRSGANSFTGGNERLRIDSSGRLLVGTSSTRAVAGRNANFLIEGTNAATAGQSVVRNSNDAFGPGISLAKSRGTTNGSSTIVQSGDELGYLIFAGANDTDANTQAARIEAQVDGTPGASDMPGRLVFSTTADGASSPTERMRIAQNGVVTIQNGAVAVIGTLTDAATITPDLAADCNFTVTLGGARTIANPTNITAGQSGSIFLVQDGTGGRTASWGSYWDFPGGTAPTLSTAANAVDRVDYIVRSSTSIHTVFTANYS